MRALLGSGGFRTDERRELLVQTMREFFGDVGSILFVPYALADHDGYLDLMREKGLDAGYRLDGIHTHDNPVAAVKEAQAIYVGGGNTFRLIRQLHELNLVETIRNRVRSGEAAYMGVSAGANAACPTMQTTNDMPITYPPSFNAIDLVPFQINAHYYPGQVHFKSDDGSIEEHFGETRDLRIQEVHEMNDAAVVGLYEGAMLLVEGDRVSLRGGPARIFRRQQEPEDVTPGADLSALLSNGTADRG